MIDLLAQAAEQLPQINPITEKSAIAILIGLIGFGFYWAVFVVKPREEKRLAAELDERAQRIVREDGLAAKQSQVFDILAEAVKTIYDALAEQRELNKDNHQRTHDKLEKIEALLEKLETLLEKIEALLAARKST